MSNWNSFKKTASRRQWQVTLLDQPVVPRTPVGLLRNVICLERRTRDAGKWELPQLLRLSAANQRLAASQHTHYTCSTYYCGRQQIDMEAAIKRCSPLCSSPLKNEKENLVRFGVFLEQIGFGRIWHAECNHCLGWFHARLVIAPLSSFQVRDVRAVRRKRLLEFRQYSRREGESGFFADSVPCRSRQKFPTPSQDASSLITVHPARVNQVVVT